MTSPKTADPTAPWWIRSPWLPMLLLAITLLVRAQTLGNPVIEFDEQFYRVVGERMLQGAVPFVDIWDRKPIGLFLLYAGAAAVGGPHALSYQLLAALFVAGTAWLIFAMARIVAGGWRGPLIAATLYILWLNLLQGEGGQASVFTALPTVGAAFLVLRQVAEPQRRGRLAGDGAAAMLLIGLAAQIKYTVLFEGVYLGLILLWLALRGGRGLVGGLTLGAAWAFLAALPTLLAWGVYAVMGQGQTWLFANITSIFLRAPMPLDDLLGELAGGLATIALLLLAAWLGWRRLRPLTPAGRFIIGWAIMANLALLVLRSFSPHYWIPLVPPLVLIAVPALEAMRRFALGLTLLAFAVGQLLIGFFIWSKGDGETVARMVAAMGPVPNCIFVFDGFPALYAESRSCLPGRYLFPGHLNGIMEAGSLGVDPVREVEGIMARRPDAIVTDWPIWSLHNPATKAIVDRELAAHYRLVLKQETGKGRFRMVYRRKVEDARP